MGTLEPYDSRRAAYDRLWHMPSLISFLPRSEQLTLLDDLNYLNMDEIREFCDEHKVPYTIWVERADKNCVRLETMTGRA
jgi:hypothetical protein